MTATITDIPALTVETAPLEAVTFDFYRDIHKGIRRELFAVTSEGGRIDPGDTGAVQALGTRWRSMTSLLVSHAEHEEIHVQPVLEGVAPELAEQVIPVHRELEARAAALEVLADRAGSACPAEARLMVHRLYLGLAGFTSAYLAHQEFEELVVMPALSAAIPVDELVAIDMAIVASVSPEEMVQSATIMLPAMNVEDRVDLVGAMREGMPTEVFAGVWGLVEGVLGPVDAAQLAARLGLPR